MSEENLTSKNNNNKVYVKSGFWNMPYGKREKPETLEITQSFLNKNTKC